MTKNEKKKYEQVARLGCIICKNIFGISGAEAEVHHVRRFGGKRSNAPIIPLCPEHHRLGNESYHVLGAKGFERHYNVSCESLIKHVESEICK